MTKAAGSVPHYLAYGEDADGIAMDRKAQSVALSSEDEASKRSRLLSLALADPRLIDRARRADSADSTRAITSLSHKILASPMARNPLDLTRVAAGDSFSGWVYKTFKLMIEDSRRKRLRKASENREVSLDGLLDDDGGHAVGEERLGIAVHDRPNPYRTITMRRPMGTAYRHAEDAMRCPSGNTASALDSALDSLHDDAWVLADETDRVDDRLILSLLMPRLSGDERVALDAMLPGLGTMISYGDRGSGLGGLWKILDSCAKRTGVTSMVVWERVTHRLFDMRWTGSYR